MGKDKIHLNPLLPMTYTDTWEASYTTDQPSADWMNLNFNDSDWRKGQAAFATRRMPRLGTVWNTEDIWIRRSFDLEQDFSSKELYLMCTNEGVTQLYLNGEKLFETGYVTTDAKLKLTDDMKKKLSVGKNVLAAHSRKRAGQAINGFVDFGLFYKNEQIHGFEKEAVQKSVDVLPTQTFYTFVC